jgi:hypothetical protein
LAELAPALDLAVGLELAVAEPLPVATADADDVDVDEDADDEEEHAAAPTVTRATTGASAHRRLVLLLDTGSSHEPWGYFLLDLRLRSWSM